MAIPQKLTTGFRVVQKFVMKYIIRYGLTTIQARRVFKAGLATTICFIFVLINPIYRKLGTSSYLCIMLSAAWHPGRRMGAMVQAFVLSQIGLGLGLPYTIFSHFTATKVYENTGSLQRALGLLVIFEVIMLTMVSYLRVVAPRLFQMGFIFFLVVHFSYVENFPIGLGFLAYQFSVPLLASMAVCLLVNVFVFPEFGSTYIGNTITSAIHEAHLSLNKATIFFSTADKKSPSVLASDFASVISQRKKVRDIFSQCQAVMLECTFEMSFAFMAPQELKPMVKLLQELSITESALTVACELEFAVFSSMNSSNNVNPMKSGANAPNSSALTSNLNKSDKHQSLVEKLKPTKEVSFADKEVLLTFLETVRAPVLNLLQVMSESLTDTILTVAQAYDVPKKHVPIINLPDDFDLVDPIHDKPIDSMFTESRKARVITIEDLDEQLKALVQAINLFDIIVKDALSKISGSDIDTTYIMPRDEFFLLSSFLLNYRESAMLISKVLENSRTLLQTRLRRQSRGWMGRKLWFSIFNSKKIWSKFLKSGYNEPDEAHCASVVEKKSIINYEDDDEIRTPSNKSRYTTPGEAKIAPRMSGVLFKVRTALADALDAMGKHKMDIKATFQNVFLLMLVSFPMFSASMRSWYVDLRGVWVGFIAMLSFEASVGATIYTLIARAILLVVGSSWGYALYVGGSHGKNPYVMTVMFAIALLPFYYILLVSPYGKAGTFSIVSCIIVPITVVRSSDPHASILDSYAKRVISLLVGGTVTVLVQYIVFPKKARVLLREDLIQTMKYMQLMLGQLAIQLDGEHLPDSTAKSDTLYPYYGKKARSSLAMAEAYLGVSSQEIRLKGSFKQIQVVYKEMFFVLHQILDRFDTVKFLRQQYGSAALEDLSPYVFKYRRDVYASMITIMRAVEEALHTKKPLPQFLPSARIAHLRMVNRVRTILVGDERPDASGVNVELDEEEYSTYHKKDIDPSKRHKMLLRRYMGWSAVSSALEEVIEYLEELVDLTKLLVGYNEFRYGFLSRPLYETWAELSAKQFDEDMSRSKEDESSESPPSDRSRSHDGNLGSSTGIKPKRTKNVVDDDDDLEPQPEPQPYEPPQFLGQYGQTMSPLERQATLELPKTLRKRKNSLFRVSPLQNENFGWSNRQAISESEELPVSLKRIVSRRHSVVSTRSS